MSIKQATTTARSIKRTTATAGDRAELRRLTREALNRELSFMPNPAFKEMEAAGYWREVLAEELCPHAAAADVASKRPAQIEQLCNAPC